MPGGDLSGSLLRRFASRHDRN